MDLLGPYHWWAGQGNRWARQPEFQSGARRMGAQVGVIQCLAAKRMARCGLFRYICSEFQWYFATGGVFWGGGGGITPEINNFGFDFETVTNLWSYFIPKLELFMLVSEFQVKILNEADLHIELPRLATLSRQFIFSWDHLHVSLEAVKYDVGELKVGCNQLEVIR